MASCTRTKCRKITNWQQWHWHNEMARTKSRASLSAPAPKSSCMQSKWPLREAQISAVFPYCASYTMHPQRKYQYVPMAGSRPFQNMFYIRIRQGSKQSIKIWTTMALTQRNGTHKIMGILVGPGTQKQPHAVQVAIEGGTNQRRASVLLNQSHVFFATESGIPVSPSVNSKDPRKRDQAIFKSWSIWCLLTHRIRHASKSIHQQKKLTTVRAEQRTERT